MKTELKIELENLKREIKAIEIILNKEYKIKQLHSNLWEIKKANKRYIIKYDKGYICSCPDFYFKALDGCKHIKAVQRIVEIENEEAKIRSEYQEQLKIEREELEELEETY